MSVANQITQFRLPNGDIVALVDWTDRPLYSTCDLGNNFTSQTVTLFQAANGRPVPTAETPGAGAVNARTNDLVDTNISTQGGAATTEEFLVYAIKPVVRLFNKTNNDFTTRTSVAGVAPPFGPGATRTCLNVMAAQLLIQLKVSMKVYSQASFGAFNTGFGTTTLGGSSVPGTAAAAAVAQAHNGWPGQDAVRTLSIPQHIGGTEKYQLQILNPTGAACDFGITETAPPTAGSDDLMASVTIYLFGLYKRPVS